MTVRIINGDCMDELRKLPDASVDSCVTDPPYGLKFMGKLWDHGIPAAPYWVEVLRVLKPGAHLLAFGGTRTHHRLMVAIEDAGWEIRDCVMWVYGSGFPKSLDVSKAIDKAAGVEREVTGPGNRHNSKRCAVAHGDTERLAGGVPPVTAPATDAAKQWQGWGAALKPAWEPIVMARKPLIGTVTANVQQYGTGALNIDGCRIPGEEDGSRNRPPSRLGSDLTYAQDEWTRTAIVQRNDTTGLGRWPANLIHDGSEEVLACFPDAPGQQRSVGPEHGAKASVNVFGDYGARDTFNPRGDLGSAARFFYCAKASKTDRDEGLYGLESDYEHSGPRGHSANGDGSPRPRPRPRSNTHPTVKPTDLMRYLCRLVTPKGGTVLDPFMGSGSTGRGAIREGFNFIGIEIDPEYCEIARIRIHADAPLFADAA